MARKNKVKPEQPAKPSSLRLLPPANGATVRMYRPGHGDCFLLSFATTDPDAPTYVLIDFGYKPGSGEAYVGFSSKQIADSIREATDGHLHVVVVTHEHQDHLNGFTEGNFAGMEIDELWFAWTEDPADELANQLRAKAKDKLLGLLGARNRLAAVGDADTVGNLDEFLAFELGGEEVGLDQAMAASALGLLGAAPGLSHNKRSMKMLKDRAKRTRFLHPHSDPRKLPGTNDVRAYPLGPPRDIGKLGELDPIGSEEFHLGSRSDEGGLFLVDATSSLHRRLPFASRYGVPLALACADPLDGAFFNRYCGPAAVAATPDLDEVPDDAAWRRIENDWLYSAEQLALDINNSTNNTSVVLAFELGKGGKVLLFAADAQRGNWLTWANADFKLGQDAVTVRDLLGRTVLYKVGHHGSHNATLNGQLSDTYANVSWMGLGEHAGEFTAMIPAVRAWADTQKGWDHPRPEIKDALLRKASGRVLQTDTQLEHMHMPEGADSADWQRFRARVSAAGPYFDLQVLATS